LLSLCCRQAPLPGTRTRSSFLTTTTTRYGGVSEDDDAASLDGSASVGSAADDTKQSEA